MLATTGQTYLCGQTIGRYRVEEVIGSGTFGEVYKAFDLELMRNVAIKVRSRGLARGLSGKDAVLKEARIHALAEHTNIVPVHDVLEYENSVLIVMRLVNGGDLDQAIQNRETPFTVAQALKIMRRVLSAMAYAHSQGIVHLDLKPGNIRISLTGEVLVMDFGIATFLGQQSFINGRPNGTPAYMSPEQVHCRFMDARSDIYSLGIILYKMVTGRHPFTNVSSIKEMLDSHLETEPLAPSSIVPELPEKLDNVILKALEKKPRHRFHSCQEFATALERACGMEIQHEQIDRDLRWDHRAAVCLKVRIQTECENGFIFAETTNLSVSGANLRVSADMRLGSKIVMEFYIPVDEDYLKVTTNAVVLWKDEEPDNEHVHIGVSFNDLKDEERYRISIFVRNSILEGNADELSSERTMTFS